ncbi:MAG: hypothetical protein NTV25_07330, partial [Methanothrix sp.]|nr:hypothetical protein [Methanothrix sp.]
MSDDLREKSTKSLVNEICLSKDHNYLFSEIRENKNLRSVFFLHKLELFPENYGMRWFYLTNVNCTQQEN